MQSLKPSDMWQYVVGIKVPVFWSDQLPLFPCSYLKTAADSFKMFVHVHLATWDRIPQGSVDILLMPSLVQSLSMCLTVTVANTQSFISVAVHQSCDAVS